MKQQLADFLEVFQDTSKTGVMAVLLVLATILRLKGYIDGPGFVGLLQTTTVSYFGTTAAAHFVEMVKDTMANKLQAAKDKS